MFWISWYVYIYICKKAVINWLKYFIQRMTLYAKWVNVSYFRGIPLPTCNKTWLDCGGLPTSIKNLIKISLLQEFYKSFVFKWGFKVSKNVYIYYIIPNVSENMYTNNTSKIHLYNFFSLFGTQNQLTVTSVASNTYLPLCHIFL